jgi:hypothetical protein
LPFRLNFVHSDIELADCLINEITLEMVLQLIRACVTLLI